MVKFVKSVLDKARAAKSALKLKTAMKGQQGIVTFFSIWFWCIDQYAGGSPSKLAEQVMRIYLIPFTPGDWLCTDGEFKGVKAKRRLMFIKSNWSKEKIVKKNDVRWLKKELRPAFEADLKEKGLTIGDLLADLPEDKIIKNVNKLKKDNKFKEMLK